MTSLLLFQDKVSDSQASKAPVSSYSMSFYQGITGRSLSAGVQNVQ